MTAELVIAEVEARAPDIVTLASYLSVATVVDPVALRAVRERMMPHSDAGLEADLWFSPLVRGATSAGVVLDPAIARILRDRLASEDLAAYRRARHVLRQLHSGKPAIEQIEEELRFLVPPEAADPAVSEGLLRLAHAGVRGGSHERRAAAALRTRLLPDLPATPAAAELAASLSLSRGGTDGERRAVTVRRVRGVLEIVDGEQTMPGGAVVRVAASEPLLIEVRSGGIRHRVELGPGGRAAVPVAAGRTELIDVDGARTRIRATIPTRARDAEIPARRARRADSSGDLVLSADLSNVTSLAGALWGLCRETAVVGDVVAVGAGGLLAALARQRGADGALRVLTGSGKIPLGASRRAVRGRLARLLAETPPDDEPWTPDLVGGTLRVLVAVSATASIDVVTIDDPRDAVDLLAAMAMRPGWPLPARASARLTVDCPIDLVDRQRGRALVVTPSRLGPPSGLAFFATARETRASVAGVTTTAVHRAPDTRIHEIPDLRFGDLRLSPGPIGRRVQAANAIPFGAAVAATLPRRVETSSPEPQDETDLDRVRRLIDETRWDGAMALIERMIDLHRRSGSRTALATDLLLRAEVEQAVGMIDATRASAAEALALFTEAADAVGSSQALVRLALAAHDLGDRSEAEDLLAESIRRLGSAPDVGDARWVQGYATVAFAAVAIGGPTDARLATLDDAIERAGAVLGTDAMARLRARRDEILDTGPPSGAA